MILAGTGHRPPALGLSYDIVDRDRLDRFVYNELDYGDTNEISLIYTGMAQGFDQSLAVAAKLLKIPYIAVLPFEGMDARWPQESRDRFNTLLKHADDVIIIRDKYSKRAYFERDIYMVDQCDCLVALYNEENKDSGTGITVGYARDKSKAVINLWESWANER